MKLFLNFFLITNFLVQLQAKDFSAEKDVEFLLRVRNWPQKKEEVFRLGTVDGILKSSFNPAKPTSFLIHGFTEDRNAPHYPPLSKELLRSEDQNVFMVDWGLKSKTLWYPEAVNRVPKVAEVVATFVNILQTRASLSLNSTTIIGMSLGAHISGLAGKLVQGGKVRRLIGLDPAGPAFSAKEVNKRLSLESAKYTECIHTGFYFGIRDPICHVDFYVNGGRHQPGCKINGVDNVACSHGRAVEVFKDSLAKPKSYFGYKCTSLKNAEDKNCKGKPGAFVHDKINEAEVRGIFLITTNLQAPYGRGFVEN